MYMYNTYSVHVRRYMYNTYDAESCDWNEKLMITLTIIIIIIVIIYKKFHGSGGETNSRGGGGVYQVSINLRMYPCHHT